MNTFKMPSLGSDMEAGTLIEQLVPAGSAVRRGDVVAAVETQKGAIEIEVFQDGVLEEWLASPGTRVPVGTPLATLRGEGEAAAEPAAEAASEPAPPVQPLPARPPAPPPQRPHRPATRPRASPAARRRAAQAGLDLAALAPDPGRALHLADVEALLAQPQEAAPGGMRAAIAAAMARSKREIPHYYLSHTADLTALEAFLADWNAAKPPQDRLLPVAAYVKALARAAQKYPEFCGHFEDGQFRPAPVPDVGLAISLRGGGLVAPALFDPAAQNLEDLMQEIRDLVERVRAGRFRARELTGAAITLSSLGERGVEALFGVIYPPQVALVGIGTPALRPWVADGQVAARQAASLTLSADHRVSDGHRGALFLRAIAQQLQQPEAL